MIMRPLHEFELSAGVAEMIVDLKLPLLISRQTVWRALMDLQRTAK